MYEVGSAAVFPLRVDGELAGTFGLQHAERNAFSPELVALLERLAANICFALENFKREARRLEAERALRESEQRFRALTELSSDWYWQQDAQLRFVSTSGASDARGGITPEAHVGLCRWELPRTEILGQTWDEHRRVLEARQPFQDLLLRRHGENGEMRYVSVNGQPFFDAQGAFAGYYGIAKDVTNRIVAELALRESEARFRSLTDLSADFYWETDANSTARAHHAGRQRAGHQCAGQRDREDALGNRFHGCAPSVPRLRDRAPGRRRGRAAPFDQRRAGV